MSQTNKQKKSPLWRTLGECLNWLCSFTPTPHFSFLPCSVSPESPWHLKFLGASNWLQTLGGHSQVSGWSALPHLSTLSHLCWLSYLHDCLEMLTPGWRPGPHTAGPVPVLLAGLTLETLFLPEAASHLPATATHGTNGLSEWCLPCVVAASVEDVLARVGSVA